MQTTATRPTRQRSSSITRSRRGGGNPNLVAGGRGGLAATQMSQRMFGVNLDVVNATAASCRAATTMARERAAQVKLVKMEADAKAKLIAAVAEMNKIQANLLKTTAQKASEMSKLKMELEKAIGPQLAQMALNAHQTGLNAEEVDHQFNQMVQLANAKHGVNMRSISHKYSALIDGALTDEELNYMLTWASGADFNPAPALQGGRGEDMSWMSSQRQSQRHRQPVAAGGGRGRGRGRQRRSRPFGSGLR